MSIKIGGYIVPARNGQPEIVGSIRSVLPCGCTFLQGKRQDNGEVAAAGFPCDADHKDMMTLVHERIAASLYAPTNRPLIQEINRIMEETYAEKVGAEPPPD